MMTKEELIKKWLDNELTAQEMQQFKELEEYESFIKLSEKAHFFKAPDFNSSLAFEKIQPIIESKRKNKKLLQKIKPFVQIAAVFLIGLIVYASFFRDNLTTIQTLASQKTVVNLPDTSVAQLNSMSELSYHKDSWNKHRTLEMNGEAYFKVAKGSRFDVQTSSGTVSVLGTQFNVKNRQNYFEVVCYEGSVKVATNLKTTILAKGDMIRIINGKIISNHSIINHPTWIDNYSSFKSVPFSEVIAEFERQYDVKIATEIDTKTVFTGTFSHTNKEQALLSITIPMNLKYEIKSNKTIKLY